MNRTNGGVGYSNAADGSSPSAAPPQLTPTALGPPDLAAAFSNSAVREVISGSFGSRAETNTYSSRPRRH